MISLALPPSSHVCERHGYIFGLLHHAHVNTTCIRLARSWLWIPWQQCTEIKICILPVSGLELRDSLQSCNYCALLAHSKALRGDMWGMQDLLPPYLDALIARLLGLLRNGESLVQEGALTALASVADCAKANFVVFYDQVFSRPALLYSRCSDNFLAEHHTSGCLNRRRTTHL